MHNILHMSLPVYTLSGCQAITRLHVWDYHILNITGSQQKMAMSRDFSFGWRDLFHRKLRDLKVCQPNVEMHCIQNYSSDSSDAEDEKQETTDDLTAHLKPLDPDKRSITTVALNAAPVIASKVSSLCEKLSWISSVVLNIIEGDNFFQISTCDCNIYCCENE